MNVAEHEFAGQGREVARTHKNPARPTLLGLFGMNGPTLYSYVFRLRRRRESGQVRPVSYGLHTQPPFDPGEGRERQEFEFSDHTGDAGALHDVPEQAEETTNPFRAGLCQKPVSPEPRPGSPRGSGRVAPTPAHTCPRSRKSLPEHRLPANTVLCRHLRIDLPDRRDDIIHILVGVLWIHRRAGEAR